MRTGLLGVAVVVAVSLVGVGVADFAAGTRAEYRLSRGVRTAAGLDADPFVAMPGFPLLPGLLSGHYRQIEIRATGVRRPVIGIATLEATLYSVDAEDAGTTTTTLGPDTRLTARHLESRVILDSVHLGRWLGMPDLMVDPPGGAANAEVVTESGISANRGLVFTATPRRVGVAHPVSVLVDLSLSGPDRSTLIFTATGIATGPGITAGHVPDELEPEVLAAFTARLPQQQLPFGVPAEVAGARGSDVIIEGTRAAMQVGLTGFRPSDGGGSSPSQ